MGFSWRGSGVLMGLVVVAATCVLLALLVWPTGKSVETFFARIWLSTFGNPTSFARVLVKTTAVLLSGLAVLLALRANFWNIGAEGQMAIGAAATTGVALFASTPYAWLTIMIALVAGGIAGGVWAFWAGWLKARWDINEMLLTLMSNFIALQVISWLVHGPWRSPQGFPYSASIDRATRLPVLWRPPLHWGLVIALLLVPLLSMLLWKTKLGYRIRAVGADAQAAHIAGMPVAQTLLIAVFLSGLLAGLGGGVQVLGEKFALRLDVTGPNYGYIGIAVALLARVQPVYTVFTALLFGSLLASRTSIQVFLSGGAENVILGVLIVLFLILDRFLDRRKR